MRQLTSYLARLFATDALILFGVAAFLMWLVNCLRYFELVSVKGQSFGTLAVQAFYVMPTLSLSFFYICAAIGIARALVALQNSHELHIIHTSRGISGLWRAAALVTFVAMAGVLTIAHVVEPWANRQLNALSASVAADLVSTTMKPNRFTQATPGVILMIGGRGPNGSITEFFADDRRDKESRRTYIAQTAQVMEGNGEYILELRDGVQQNLGSDGRYSEIRFSRYLINVENFSQSDSFSDPWSETDSIDLLTRNLQSGEWKAGDVKRLLDRSAEALRVLGLCLFVVAIAAFPSGKRTRIRVPIEAVVMIVAFTERGIGSYSPLGVGTGAAILTAVSALILAVRIWPRRPIREVLA